MHADAIQLWESTNVLVVVSVAQTLCSRSIPQTLVFAFRSSKSSLQLVYAVARGI